MSKKIEEDVVTDVPLTPVCADVLPDSATPLSIDEPAFLSRKLDENMITDKPSAVKFAPN